MLNCFIVKNKYYNFILQKILCEDIMFQLLFDRKKATDMKQKIEEELKPIRVLAEQAKLCYKRTVDENNRFVRFNSTII